MNLSGLWIIPQPRLIHGPFDYLNVSVVDVFLTSFCDVPEIRERLVEKPVATLLARTQAFEIARSRRLGSKPGLYKCVRARVRARARYVKGLSHINRRRSLRYHGSTRILD